MSLDFLQPVTRGTWGNGSHYICDTCFWMHEHHISTVSECELHLESTPPIQTPAPPLESQIPTFPDLDSYKGHLPRHPTATYLSLRSQMTCQNDSQVPSLPRLTGSSYSFPADLKPKSRTAGYKTFNSHLSDSNILLHSLVSPHTGLLDASRTYQVFSDLGATPLAGGFDPLNREIRWNTTLQRKLLGGNFHSALSLIPPPGILPHCTQHRAPPQINLFLFLVCLSPPLEYEFNVGAVLVDPLYIQSLELSTWQNTQEVSEMTKSTKTAVIRTVLWGELVFKRKQWL